MRTRATTGSFLRVCVFFGCICAVLAILGCASNRYAQTDNTAFVLGTTTKEHVLGILGEPTQQKTDVYNSKKVQAITYKTFSTGLYFGTTNSVIDNTIAVRSLTYMFYDNVLVAKMRSSSFKEDSTFFEYTKATRVTQGMTKEEVIGLMGMPSGENIYPVVSDPTLKGIVYSYLHVREKGGVWSPNAEAYLIELKVVLDKDDRVLETEMSSVGEL